MKKKLLTMIAFLTMLGSGEKVSAQELPYVFSKVAENTYAITMTLEEMKADNTLKDYIHSWGNGLNMPKGYVLYENEDIKIIAATNGGTAILTSSAKFSDMHNAFPEYNGYVYLCDNVTLNESTSIENTDNINGNSGFVKVLTKKNGTLSFGCFNGNNSIIIGIYSLPTEQEEGFGKTLVYKNGTPASATEALYVEGKVLQDREYLLLSGGGKKKAYTMHQIKFTPATPPTLTLKASGSGMSTFSSAFTYKVPEGLEAYTASVNGNTVSLNKVEDGIIPANTGVVLMGTKGKSYTMEDATTSKTAIEGNSLSAAVEETTISNDNTYVLVTNSEGKGQFKRFTNGDVIPAGKAYLTLNSDAKTLNLDFGGVTEINNAVANGNGMEGLFYTLDGLKTEQPVKGVIYIHNGKKFIIK